MSDFSLSFTSPYTGDIDTFNIFNQERIEGCIANQTHTQGNYIYSIIEGALDGTAPPNFLIEFVTPKFYKDLRLEKNVNIPVYTKDDDIFNYFKSMYPKSIQTQINNKNKNLIIEILSNGMQPETGIYCVINQEVKTEAKATRKSSRRGGKKTRKRNTRRNKKY